MRLKLRKHHISKNLGELLDRFKVWVFKGLFVPTSTQAALKVACTTKHSDV